MNPSESRRTVLFYQRLPGSWLGLGAPQTASETPASLRKNRATATDRAAECLLRKGTVTVTDHWQQLQVVFKLRQSLIQLGFKLVVLLV